VFDGILKRDGRISTHDHTEGPSCPLPNPSVKYEQFPREANAAQTIFRIEEKQSDRPWLWESDYYR